MLWCGRSFQRTVPHYATGECMYAMRAFASFQRTSERGREAMSLIKFVFKTTKKIYCENHSSKTILRRFFLYLFKVTNRTIGSSVSFQFGFTLCRRNFNSPFIRNVGSEKKQKREPEHVHERRRRRERERANDKNYVTIIMFFNFNTLSMRFIAFVNFKCRK